MQPPVLILHAPGTNRDGDAAAAVAQAGGSPVIRTLSQLRKNHTAWLDYTLLILPGGFSFGDALGAGRLWALELLTWFEDQLNGFIQSGHPVLGICNGFQALVKTGVLPGDSIPATLTFNASGRFECRWVALKPDPSNPSPWLSGIERIDCPVAHGEGRFLTQNGKQLALEQKALVYLKGDGQPANGSYPANPNGSPDDIAGVTNPDGNVLGLMPHPEDFIHPYQHPNWSRQAESASGLALFRNGLYKF